MKTLIIRLKNLVPYLLLIIVYFFFINIEAHKIRENNKFKNIKKETKRKDKSIKYSDQRISIPVIPYDQ